MKKNKKNKQQINYLDLIPVRPEKLGWHIDRRERVVLEVKNEGFFNRIAQTYFRRPQTTKVHLDVQGSYLAVDRRGADSDGTGRPSERTFWRSSRAAVSKNCEIFSDFRELSFYQF